ncbi:unnamed protein product [Symbiodinium natans]|uniref:Calpastatin n=1 Tax=Symbiodinium natans TaxID=878477 RepID=A0A812RQU1_9DINO|nr:unnamed protein product [Symbiodinium natans]
MRPALARQLIGLAAAGWAVRCQVAGFSSVDKYNLQRFVDAQAPVYQGVLKELRAGQKRNHWMWFIFPQISGLGRSDIARFYSIASLDEASAYLGHSILGPRLRECVAEILKVEGKTSNQIFGQVDSMKLLHGPTQKNAGLPETQFGPTQKNAGPAGSRHGPTQKNTGFTETRYGPTQKNAGPTETRYGPTQKNAGPTETRYGPTQKNAGPADF